MNKFNHENEINSSPNLVNRFVSVENSNTSEMETPKSNNSIISRVTNSVSGMLSHVAFSEWLSTKKQEKPTDNSNFSHQEPSTSKTFQQYSGKSFAPIRTSSTPKCFKPDHEMNSNFLPSTSSTPETANGNMALASEDNLELLKKSLCDTNLKSPFAKLNGSMSIPSAAKKRNRDQEYQERNDNMVDSSLIATSLHSLTANEAHASKKPRFSISSYGSPYSSIQNSSYTSTDNVTCNDSSPYYPGKVVYGGAFNYHKSRGRIITRKTTTPRAQLTPYVNKRLQADEDGGLSSAAKRILSCIDRISTPLSNSKRIPVFASKLTDDYNYVSDFHKHRPSLKSTKEIASPPISKLLTPGIAKVSSVIPSLLEKNKAKKSIISRSSVLPLSNSSKDSILNASNDSIFVIKTPDHPTSSYIDNFHKVVKTNFEVSPLIEKPFSVTFSETPKLKEKSFVSGSLFQPRKSSEPVIKESLPKSLVDNCQKPVEKQAPIVKTVIEVVPIKKNKFNFSIPEIIVADASTVSYSSNKSKFTFKDPVNEDAITPSATLQNGFGNAFVVAEGSWECSCCMLQNRGSVSNCLACQTPNLMKSKSKLDDLNTKTAPLEPLKSVWGSQSENMWECDVCLISNLDSVPKCVACESAKPIQQKSTRSESSGFESSLGDKFKSPTDVWNCTSCLIVNSNSDQFCVACQACKPLVSHNVPEKVVSDWGDKFKPTLGKWDCEICLIQNEGAVVICVACQTPKPGSGSVKESVTVPFSQKLPADDLNYKFGFTSSSSSSSGCSNGSDWDCETCLVRNTSKVNKCECCEAPKDKTSGDLVSQALTGNFKFGAIASNSETFKFGTTASLKDSSSTSETFSFGVAPAKKDDSKKDIPATSNTTSEITVSSSFGTTAFKQPETISPVSVASSTSETSITIQSPSTFTFGSGNIAEKKTDVKIQGAFNSKSDDTSASVNFSFIKSTEKVPKENLTFTFGDSKKVVENKDEKKADVPGLFSFGSSKPTVVTTTNSVSPFSFGQSNSEKTLPSNSLNTFGAASRSDSLVTPTFGAAKETAKVNSTVNFQSSSKSPLFALGSKEVGPSSNEMFPRAVMKSQTIVSNPKTASAVPVFGFGKPAAPTELKTTFGSIANPINTVPEKKTDSPFTFGAASSEKKDTPSLFSFGKASNDSGASFSFGNSVTTKEKPSSFGFSKPVKDGFNFGGSAKAATGFSFGNCPEKPVAPTKTTAFSFGSTNHIQDQSSFSFAQNTPHRFGNNEQSTPQFQNTVSTSNPFNILSSGTAGGPQRKIKKAVRRNK